MVLFLSSDILALHLCLSGLSLLFCPSLHGANVGHRRLSVIWFGFSRLCLRHTLFGCLGKGVLITFLGGFGGSGCVKVGCTLTLTPRSRRSGSSFFEAAKR